MVVIYNTFSLAITRSLIATAVGLLTFITAARDIGTIVLLATGKTRTLALLMLHYTAVAELERATVVACMIVMLVVAGALLPHTLGGQFQIRS